MAGDIGGWQGSFCGAGGDPCVWVLKMNQDGTINFNPSSGAFISDTSATVFNTAVTGEVTTATVTNTTVGPVNTNAVISDTDAIILQQAP